MDIIWILWILDLILGRYLDIMDILPPGGKIRGSTKGNCVLSKNYCTKLLIVIIRTINSSVGTSKGTSSTVIRYEYS